MSETPNPFIRKLRHGAILSEEDERTLARLSGPAQRLSARQDIASEGKNPHHLLLIMEGWACRYRDLHDGRRQIISFVLPGDLCEPFGALPRAMGHALGTVTPVTYVRVPSSAARKATLASPAIEQALWWDALTASAIMNERAVSLGARTAFERLAHLICELDGRLAMVGLADETGFDCPLTQQDLAHALGMTAVHLNRSLKTLRGTGVMSMEGRRLTIKDRAGLHDIAMFEPGILLLGGAVLY